MLNILIHEDPKSFTFSYIENTRYSQPPFSFKLYKPETKNKKIIPYPITSYKLNAPHLPLFHHFPCHNTKNNSLPHNNLTF